MTDHYAVRALPHPGYERPYTTEETHGGIRTWLEQVTSPNPYEMVDAMVYNNVYGLAARADYRFIVIEVLNRRLEQGGISAHKAVILAQAIPPDSLTPLLDGLISASKPKDDDPETYINHIAKTLVAPIEAANKAADEQAAKEKYDTWCSVFGRPAEGHDWRPLPQECEWGMWGLVWIDPEEWWKAPKKKD